MNKIMFSSMKYYYVIILLIQIVVMAILQYRHNKHIQTTKIIIGGILWAFINFTSYYVFFSLFTKSNHIGFNLSSYYLLYQVIMIMTLCIFQYILYKSVSTSINTNDITKVLTSSCVLVYLFMLPLLSNLSMYMFPLGINILIILKAGDIGDSLILKEMALQYSDVIKKIISYYNAVFVFQTIITTYFIIKIKDRYRCVRYALLYVIESLVIVTLILFKDKVYDILLVFFPFSDSLYMWIYLFAVMALSLLIKVVVDSFLGSIPLQPIKRIKSLHIFKLSIYALILSPIILLITSFISSFLVILDY